jgi:hypothetical protein
MGARCLWWIDCDAKDCFQSIECCGNYLPDLKTVAKKKGWREVDGKWFCPAHDPKKGEEAR